MKKENESMRKTTILKFILFISGTNKIIESYNDLGWKGH